MNLFKSAATVGGMTLVSRVLGFFRDMMMAIILGTGPVADAFVVAFRVPNLFRRLFGEGAFNSAFVPLFAKKYEGEGAGSAKKFAQEIMSVLVLALFGFTILAEIFMPLLVRLMAPGFLETPEKFDLTVLMTRIAFPYLAFMSLVAMLSGVLNSLGRFFAAAAAPVLLNVVMIGVLFFLLIEDWGATPRAGEALVWGVSFAGLLQFVLLYFSCKRAGISIGLQKPKITPGVKKMVTLGIPGVIAGGITQINLFIGTIIASLQESAVSFLYYADRIYQFPLGIVGVAIGVVLLPDLSRRLRAEDMKGADNAQNRAIEYSLLLTLPAAVALMIIALPIVQTIFEHGAFTTSDSFQTSLALTMFATGLPAFVLIKVFSPGFFAREDTKTPMYFAAASMALNAAGSFALFNYFGHVGIAIATSAAAWLNAILLGAVLYHKGQLNMDKKLKHALPRILLAAILMGVMLYYLGAYTETLLSASQAIFIRVVVLVCVIVLGIVTFFVATHFLGVAKLGELPSLLKRK